jgi:hypothetical protein
VNSKIHRQCVLPWRPGVECYRNQVVMVGLGSKMDSWLCCCLVDIWLTVKYIATITCCPRFSDASKNLSCGFGRRSVAESLPLMARVAFLSLSFHSSVCGPETRSSCRVTTHIVDGTQAIEIRTCRCSFDRTQRLAGLALSNRLPCI